MATLGSAVDLLHLFGDATRVRLLALLARHELTVADLVAITSLPQSSVSTHLGKLREAAVVRDRREGSSTYYALNDGAMPDEARKVWALVEGEVKDSVLEADRKRCEARVRARAKGEGFFDALAGEMERHYSPGRTWESMARALLGLLRLGDVLDVGGGDGTVAQLLAPRAKSVTLIDRSERLCEAARARLASFPDARVVCGDLHALPFEAERFDDVLLFNVLTHAESPAKALSEAARVLRPGGGLTLVTLEAHKHADVTAAYRELHPGFTVAALRRMLGAAGLSVSRCEVSSRERREPHFNVITAFAEKRAAREENETV